MKFEGDYFGTKSYKTEEVEAIKGKYGIHLAVTYDKLSNFDDLMNVLIAINSHRYPKNNNGLNSKVLTKFLNENMKSADFKASDLLIQEK